MRPLGQFLVALSALIVQFSVTLPEAVAVERSDAVFLVATPGRTGLFERAVILVFRNNAGSVGFTLNHPTDTSLAELFPGYPAARRVQSPVFNGGPQLRDSIYALVRSSQAPAESSVPVMPGLYVAFGDEDLTEVVNRFPEHARFYAGVVAWDRGDLEAEVDSGDWYVVDPDIDLVVQGSADTLWGRLVERVQTAIAKR
jgi:putative transcriptional regulator